jgi:hypothetical protein
MTAHCEDSPASTVRRGADGAVLMVLVACLNLSACGDSSAPEKPAAPAEAPRQKGSDLEAGRNERPAEDAARGRLANAVATSKGGAAVDLLYDIALRPMAAQPVEVELVFEPRSAADALEVEVSAVPGLTIVSPVQARFAPVASGEQHSTRILVVADTDGLYYINVIARMVNKVQTEARTFSVPLVVGNASAGAPAGETIPGAGAAAAGETVKSLPAEDGSTAQ